jgi:hypothetical protein
MTMTSKYWTQVQAPAGNWVDSMGCDVMQRCVAHGEHCAKDGVKARVVERVDTVVWPQPQLGDVAIYSVSPPKGKRGVSKKDDSGRHMYYVADKNSVAIRGDCILLGERDDFFGGKESKEYRSGVLHNPTWGDVFEHFRKSIPVTRDAHHCFLEGVYRYTRNVRGKQIAQVGDGDIPIYTFAAGS